MRFTATTEILAPAAQVWHVLADIDAQQRAYSAVSIERVTAGPLTVGSRWRETRQSMSVDVSQVFEVVAIEARSTLVAAATTHSVRTRSAYEVTSVGAHRARVDHVVDITHAGGPVAGAAFSISTALTRRWTTRQMLTDLQELKAAVEAS